MILPYILSASEHFHLGGFVNSWELVCLGTRSELSQVLVLSLTSSCEVAFGVPCTESMVLLLVWNPAMFALNLASLTFLCYPFLCFIGRIHESLCKMFPLKILRVSVITSPKLTFFVHRSVPCIWAFQVWRQFIPQILLALLEPFPLSIERNRQKLHAIFKVWNKHNFIELYRIFFSIWYYSPFLIFQIFIMLLEFSNLLF